MNESNESAPHQSVAPEIDAERLILPGMEATTAATSDADRTLLTGIAGEMAKLSNRAEHVASEVAAIEGQMNDLVDKLTVAAGVTITDPPADPAPHPGTPPFDKTA